MHLLPSLFAIISLANLSYSSPVQTLTEVDTSLEQILLEPFAKDYTGNLILIRHGEKNKDETGLSRAGRKRANCLREVRDFILNDK